MMSEWPSMMSSDHLSCCRNQRNSIYLCSDGCGAGPRRDALLQSGQHDRVWLWWPAAGQRLGSGRLALGRLLRPHPVWDLVQPQVHRQRRQKHVDDQRRVHAEHHEPAQQWGRTPGESHTETIVRSLFLQNNCVIVTESTEVTKYAFVFSLCRSGNPQDDVHTLSLSWRLWLLCCEDMLEDNGGIWSCRRVPEGQVRTQRSGVRPLQEEE